MYRIDAPERSHQEFSRPVQMAALGEMLTQTEIDTICHELGHRWRNRIFTPRLTVLSMVYRRLHPDKSIRATLADLAAGDEQLDKAPADTSWCEARSRLPQQLWPRLIAHSAQRLQQLVGRQYLHRGRPVYLADGSTVSMPDTPELVKAFTYADTKHGPSRFPVGRITFITHAGTEAVVDYRLDAYRTAEDAQFHALWGSLADGCICICDRKFCSFYNLAKLPQRRIDLICPLHQRRDPRRLIATGAKIGPDEWRVWLDLAPQLRKRYADPSLPEYLAVRLICVRFRRNGKRRKLWLVTTLLDPAAYPRSSVVELYRRRWGVETRIGSLKATLQMNVLPGKTEKAVRYDVAATILAHNLLWTLIHQAAELTHTPADRISFAGAIKTTLAFSSILRNIPDRRRREVYDRMLRQIADHTNPHRPGRIEPRLIKRQKRRYGFLKTSREKARQNA